jgi:DNA-binding protein HU-beta
MNKSELIGAIAEASGLTKGESSRALDGFISSVTHVLSQGEPVILTGFGTWDIRERAARVGRNPKSGEPVEIKAAKIPVFKVGKSLKVAVNEVD